jgi:hypothetical protein
MSKKKFNLKDYQKISGDEHIDTRLSKSRTEAPNVINEKQLEDYRGTEANVTIEKLLEKTRTGEEDEITEKRLDTHKSLFANKYRNEDAHTGDMNKLEEQRLKNNPVEKEKYEAASETPKKQRWWEGVKSPDGLKVAEVTGRTIAVARQTTPDFPYEKPEDVNESLYEEKTNPITVMNPEDVNPMDSDLDINDDFEIDDIASNPSKFEEMDYSEDAITGTPMASGIIHVGEIVSEQNRQEIINEAVRFIKTKHPHLDIDEHALDLSNLDDISEIGFMVAVPEIMTASNDFPIIVADDRSKKN